jgi:hypothetical protein
MPNTEYPVTAAYCLLPKKKPGDSSPGSWFMLKPHASPATAACSDYRRSRRRRHAE